MKYASLFVLIVSQLPRQRVQMCTNTIHRGKYLPGSHIQKLKMSGIASCSLVCLRRHACMSFNFNVDINECQLNSKTKNPGLTRLRRDRQFAFSDISHCKLAGCLRRSDFLKNGHIVETQMLEESPHGTVLSYTCDPGYMSKGELVCLNNSQWSSAVCVSVSSCSMVKQIQSDSGDGEYLLRLTNFRNYTTRIYCHKMKTSSPQEFLTLPNINYGLYPQYCPQNCVKDRKLGPKCRGQDGEIWFSKLRIDIITMRIFQEDKTFAILSHNNARLIYGRALYIPEPDGGMRCGTRGSFKIDLRGTDWTVSENQQWEAYGNESMIFSIKREANGSMISLNCGGFPGGCRPTGGLFLKPLPEEVSF